MVHDMRNDYTWKTGLDLEFAKDIDDECDDVLDLYEEQFMDLDIETFTGFTSSVNALLGDSSVVGTNGELKVNSSGLDDTFTESDIQVFFNGITLEQNKSYRLSFTVSSLMERNMKLELGSYISEYINITTDDQVLTFDFDMTDATSAELLTLSFGYIDGQANNATTVYLDNLMIEEFDGTDVVTDTNQITRGDFDLLPTEITVGDDQLLAACRDKEVKLNTTFTGFANSILTVEYLAEGNNPKRISSSSHTGVSMDLLTFDDETHYAFDIDFRTLDIEIELNVYLTDKGIRFEVLDEDITGDGVGQMTGIVLAPFMGASGGAFERFDLAELDYGDDEIFKEKVPGYALVPDGSGNLIRFNDNDVKLEDYESTIYGDDPGQGNHYYDEFYGYVPFKTSSMPVFGIAHGNNQAGFVAYSTSGDEYMQVVSMPEENLTYYNYTYPRFVYNKLYFQVYNKSGWGYLTTYEDRNHFDLSIQYEFLTGTEGPSADYVGMAKAYRTYLIEQGLLTEKTYGYNSIPMRMDFLMSDVEKGITGYDNMVTTTTSGVDRILTDFTENGVDNINSGLLGWQDGGITLGHPGELDFSRQIGRKRDFESLIEEYNSVGIDISFSQDYYMINEEMMNIRGNATRHTSTWYSRLQTYDIPIGLFYYARPEKSIEWMLYQTREFDKLNVASYTVTGSTNNLTSDYTDNMLRTESKQYMIDGFGELNDDVLLNAYQPNMYLWQYTDRYLNTPIYGTQFLIETDTVPFLQLVLQGTMEMYGPYSNFSFYTQKDMLRMIDYNIYPSFVITEEPAYLLTDTLSRNYYSTEYELYEELMLQVYNTVDFALSNVINSEWTNRTVVENGIVVNEYDNGIEVVINYTDEAYTYDGVIIDPVSYQVIGG